MKTLISARIVRDWHAQGKTDINVSPGKTIVTPEARSTAAELGMRLVESPVVVSQPGQEASADAAPLSGTAKHALRDAIRTQVQARLPAGQYADAELDAIIDKVLSEDAQAQAPAGAPQTQQQKHYQYQAIGDIKRIDSSSIDFGSFADTRDGAVGVADVITAADNSSMTAGYMTWTQCFFPWDLAHDEINVVLEGELHIRADGQELICRAGDAVFLPKGSRLEMGTRSSTRFMYITHASRAQQQR